MKTEDLARATAMQAAAESLERLTGAIDLDMEGQIVGIVVAVVEEAAFLDEQAARVGRGRGAGVPADGTRAGNLGQRLDGCGR